MRQQHPDQASEVTMSPNAIIARENATRWQLVALIFGVVLIGLYLAASLRVAALRLLWSDEILTVKLAQLPPLQIWKALVAGSDSMPVGYTILVHFFQEAFTPIQFAARLPSALAVFAGLLLVYDSARRLTDNLYGLLAIGLLTGSFLSYYAVEARSYGIYFFLAAAAFWIWQFARNPWRSVIFGLIFLVGVLTNYYFIVCIIPYFLMEARDWKPWRMPSATLVSGALGLFIGLLILLPATRAVKGYTTGFWAPPSAYALLGMYTDFFPVFLAAAAISVVFFLFSPAVKKPAAPDLMSDHEILGWLFLAIPLGGFVIAELATHAFYNRYFMGTLPGVAIAAACFCYRHFRRFPKTFCVVFALFVTAGLRSEVKMVIHPLDIEVFENQEAKTIGMRNLETVFRREGKMNIVIWDALLYHESRFYSAHPEMYRAFAGLNRVPELDANIRLIFRMNQFVPEQFWKLEDVENHAQDTALVDVDQIGLDALRRAGFTAKVRFVEPFRVVYLERNR